MSAPPPSPVWCPATSRIRAPSATTSPADADDDRPTAGVECGADDVAGPAAGGDRGREHPVGQQSQRRDRRELDHRLVPASDVCRVDRHPGRPARRDGNRCKTCGPGGDQRPVATVGDRHGGDVEVEAGGAAYLRQTGLDEPGDLGGGQRPLELVGREQDA